MKKYILGSLMLMSLPVMAAQYPTPTQDDNRLATAYYQQDNVTEIFVKPGIFTQIVFEEGEEYEVHALGDEAWHVASHKNFLFIKPKAPLGTTNLSIITNKRDYMFKVNYLEDKTAVDMYRVKFIYPEVQSAEAKAAAEKQAVEEGFKESLTQKVYNLDYSMRVKGNRHIAPINVYDDGTFTYFKFEGNVDLPAIYAVDSSNTEPYGKEMLVNSTVKGTGNNTLMMHKIHGLWRLRLDETVIDVYNNSLDGYGVLNQSGTASETVERVEVGGE